MPIRHSARSRRRSRPLYLIRFFESHFTFENFQTLNLTRLPSPTSTLLRPLAKSHPHPLRLSQFLYTIRAPKEGLPAWPYHRPFSTVGLATRGAPKAGLRGGAFFPGARTVAARLNHGEGWRGCFGQRREEEDEGRAGFVNMEKFRGLTIDIKFPTGLGLK